MAYTSSVPTQTSTPYLPSHSANTPLRTYARGKNALYSASGHATQTAKRSFRTRRCEGVKWHPTESPRGEPPCTTFYSIKPMPKNPYAFTYLSGSRIAAALREIGEVEYAKGELEWADREDDPYEIPAADTGELVECNEIRARLFISGGGGEGRRIDMRA
ncbi:hypothetical protein EDD15DRAFT_2255785 [Pisolithus albus]|nr:hypothetical protein EDD15DRAFT_2255785 [Pisolithus albus]